MSVYELIDYDRLLARIGIPDQQDWRCGANEPELWKYNEEGLSYDDVYADDPENLQKFGAAYDGRARFAPGGLCLSGDVNVNGLLLNHRDRNGTIWVCTNIEGWWTLPPSEIADVPRPYWDGSMLTTGRYLMRTITVSGCFMPPDPSLVWYNRDILVRCASIVRGVGLLAVCGNGTKPIHQSDEDFFNPMYDPSKMSIIQTNDVPLIETTKANGFTQFSLSFRCVYPTKQSVGERTQLIPFPKGGALNFRQYISFSLPVAYGGETGGPLEDEGMGVTAYRELAYQAGQDDPKRKYSDVLVYNSTNPIEDEDYKQLAYENQKALELYNKGNYFAYPVYVIEPFTFNTRYTVGGVEKDVPANLRYLQIINTETGETMKIVKEVKRGEQLIIDTNARRVCLAKNSEFDDPYKWDWNARGYMTLESDWVTLAAGPNQLEVSGLVSFEGSNVPRAYWRDTWIG